LIIKN
jgi:hypothetical protein